MPTPSWLLCSLPVQLIQLNRKGVGTGMDKCNVRLHGESSYTKNSSPFVHLLYGAVLDSKVRSHFIIIHLYASDLICVPNLLHNLCLFGFLFFNKSGYITADITVFRTWKRIFEGQTIKGDRARDVQKWAHKILWFRLFGLSWKND